MVKAGELVNQSVIHKSFGMGIIRSADENYLEVDFAEAGKVSRFIYPSCFYGFLTLGNRELQSEIVEVVEDWKEKSGTVKKEELQKKYEKTVQGIKARQIAAEDKKIKAARRAMEHRTAYNSKSERSQTDTHKM